MVGAEGEQEKRFAAKMWVGESYPGFALAVVLASAKAAQRRPGWKGLVHFGYATVGVAAAVREGVRNMAEAGEATWESGTELEVEGEEL